MFCLRNFAFLLIFLYVCSLQKEKDVADQADSTNAQPITILLFLIGQFILSRPCVYCSILLIILTCSLFDFSGNWFEDRWQPAITATTSSVLGNNAAVTRIVEGATSFAASAINATDGSLVNMALEGLGKRSGFISPGAAGEVNLFEWLRNASEKLSFRIPCVNVRVTL